MSSNGWQHLGRSAVVLFAHAARRASQHSASTSASTEQPLTQLLLAASRSRHRSHSSGSNWLLARTLSGTSSASAQLQPENIPDEDEGTEGANEHVQAGFTPSRSSALVCFALLCFALFHVASLRPVSAATCPRDHLATQAQGESEDLKAVLLRQQADARAHATLVKALHEFHAKASRQRSGSFQSHQADEMHYSLASIQVSSMQL